MVVAHWLRDIADIMSHTFVSISVKLIIIDNRRGKLCSYLEGGNYGVNEQDEDADKNNRVGSCEKGVGEEGADQQEGKAHLECICICICISTFSICILSGRLWTTLPWVNRY